MFVYFTHLYFLLYLTLLSTSSWLFILKTSTTTEVAAVELINNDDNNDRMLDEIKQFRVSELGSTKENDLNCFLQFDQLLAKKWQDQFNIVVDDNDGKKMEEIEKQQQLWTTNKTVLLKSLNRCMGDITKNLKNPVVDRCMNQLIRNEIESDDFISVPELYDDSLPLPFLTFFNIREISRLLFANRTISQLNEDEINVFNVAGDYTMKYKSGRDKVFVVDQSCDWKNLATLKELDDNIDDQLTEFKRQVVRSMSFKIAQEMFVKKDVKPGTWITIYRRWAPLRLRNLMELQSTTRNLKKERFTTKDLCRYATTLAKFFAEQELKILIPEVITTLKISTGDFKLKTIQKENIVCKSGARNECEKLRAIRKSYESELNCVQTFGELLSNHMLYSIIQKYVDIEPRITYPEIACKKITTMDNNIAVRYCRCVGSFCTTRHVGEIKANYYKLDHDVVKRV